MEKYQSYVSDSLDALVTMSGRKFAPPKMPFGMLKGKSAGTSMPSFAFTPGNDDLTELPAKTSDDEEYLKSDMDIPKASCFKAERSPDDVKKRSVDHSHEHVKWLSDYKGKFARHSNVAMHNSEDDDDADNELDEVPKVDVNVPERPVRRRHTKMAHFQFPSEVVNSPSTSFEQDKVPSVIETGIDAAEVLPVLQPAVPPRTVSAPVAPSRASPFSSYCSWLAMCGPLFWITVIGVLLCFPLPSFIIGFLLGSVIASFVTFVGLLFWQPKTKEAPKHEFIDYETNVKEHRPVQKYSGWINELLGEYNPKLFHIRQTYSVFVRLEGNFLRMSYPRKGIPKRAMWNEKPHHPSFVHQRYYNLDHCTVHMLPETVINGARMWNRRYPIIVALTKGAQQGLFRKVDSQEESSVVGTSCTSSEKTTPTEDTELATQIAAEFEEFEAEQVDKEGDSAGANDENEDRIPFEEVTKEMCMRSRNLVFFARTDREKYDWYHRLVAATKYTPTPEPTEEKESTESEISDISPQKATEYATLMNTSAELARYLIRYLPHDDTSAPPTPTSNNASTPDDAEGSEKEKKVEKDKKKIDPDITWLNAFAARLFYELCANEDILQFIELLIQKKLNKIKVPYFMEKLIVRDLEIGRGAPVIKRSRKVYHNEQGLWIELDVVYEGTVALTLGTKLNLLKMKDDVAGVKLVTPSPPTRRHYREHAMSDSDEETLESSSDEGAEFTEDKFAEDYSYTESQNNPHSTSKKFLRMVDKITSSKYFKHATENKYIKRAMEGVSKTPILLSVEVKGLAGTLVLNIPPYPTNRLWYGFRGNPSLWIVAKPKLGERLVTMTHVTDWIENKLVLEFQKVLVLPNMDDLIIPFLTEDLVH